MVKDSEVFRRDWFFGGFHLIRYPLRGDRTWGFCFFVPGRSSLYGRSLDVYVGRWLFVFERLRNFR